MIIEETLDSAEGAIISFYQCYKVKKAEFAQPACTQYQVPLRINPKYGATFAADCQL